MLFISADGQTYDGYDFKSVVGISVDADSDIVPRFFHRATLLKDGRVLIVGGLGLTIQPPGLMSLNDISVYEPKSDQFHRLASTDGATSLRLKRGRSSMTLTTLSDGRVLITGGNVDASGTFTGRATDTVEICDPLSGRVDTREPMNEKRAHHTATRLADGRVVIAGGKSWQVFDPTDNSWSPPVDMIRSRVRHAAVDLPAETPSLSDRVLVIAGLGGGGRWLEILDPEAMTSRQIPTMLPQYLNDLAAARLADGRVLIVGGQANFDLQTKAYVHVFDPSDESLRRLENIPHRNDGISDHEMVSIGRRVVVLGGEQQVGRQDTELDYVAIFDGDTDRWEFVGAMNQPRDDFAAVRFADDRILMIGGAISRNGVEAPTATSEIFELREVVVGDTDRDGRISRSDIFQFVETLLAPGTASPVAFRLADINGDFRIDAADVSAFNALLLDVDELPLTRRN